MSIETYNSNPPSQALEMIFRNYCSTGMWQIFMHKNPAIDCKLTANKLYWDYTHKVKDFSLINPNSDDNKFIEFFVSSKILIENKELQDEFFEFVKWLSSQSYMPVSITDEDLYGSPFLTYFPQHDVFINFFKG